MNKWFSSREFAMQTQMTRMAAMNHLYEMVQTGQMEYQVVKGKAWYRWA